MADVSMPRLSDSMEEGTILKWLKSDGDEVSKGEELVEIETDKANMTYEADEAGSVGIVAQEGDTLAVGETIARIGEGGGDGGDSGEEESEPEEDDGGGQEEQPQAEEDEAHEEPEADEAAEEPETEEAAAEEPEPQPDNSDDGRVKASPIARRMAEERGLDLASIEGTGPGGRIVKADIEKAGNGDEPEPEAAEKPAAEEEQPKQPARDGEAGRG